MSDKNRFAWQALICCVLFNGAMLGAFYFLAGEKYQEAEDVRNLALILFGGGGLATLILWGTLQLLGQPLIDKGLSPSASAVPPDGEKALKKKPPFPAPAVQILSILQRQGRLIDFLQENLDQYEDAQIGAAVRNIHEGSKKALMDNMEIEPVFIEEEGAEVTVEPGFDAHSIRLTGNIEGEPPFKGVLRHRGWQVTRIELPQQLPGQEKNRILAPAEVEIS